VEVIKREKSYYVLPNSISYRSSEDECEDVPRTKVPKKKKKASKIIFVMFKEPVLPINDSDSDKGPFSSENVTDNG
jgi:hypothetical protein